MTDMDDVDHTHPETEESFGAAFRRGPDVAADGGEGSETPTPTTMAEVDHETPTEAVDRVFERGTEGRDERV